MPAGKSEPVGQCAILRNVERAEAPVLPVVKPKKWKELRKKKSAPLAGTMGKAGNVLRKITLLVKACSAPVLEYLADWPQTGQRSGQRPEWSGAGVCRSWAPGTEN